MKKTFFKNLLRDIKNTPSRFLSIVIIIAVGVAFYSGVRATSPDMKISGDYYFDKNNFMDFKLISTLGLRDDDIAEMEKQKGVTKAEGSYSLDGVIEKDDKQLVLNINSLPEKNGINDIRMVSGRRAENTDETVVEENFLKENKLKINDFLILKSGNETNMEDNLKVTKFKIVGTAKSPLYLSEQRQISSVGNGSVRGFIYILPEVFKSEVYTEVYVRTDSPESEDSLLDNKSYNDYTKSIEKSLKEIGAIRNKKRYEDLIGQTLVEKQNEIEKSQKEINKNIQKLEIGEEKANKEIKDAEAEISENKEKLNGIKKPDFYVLGRSQNVGYETYRQDSDRIDNIGKVFPLIFFLVAALVSLTTMTRMVQEKRIEIGTFKALGYSPLAIVSHYLIYSLASSLIGSALGVLIGFRLFPPLIINAYGSLYAIPDILTPFNVSLSVQASLIAILFTTLAAALATLDELREVPASLMRPKPPKAGKKILLERMSFIWKRLKFTQKVTARNIFRYKQRFLMTVIGIAACTGLMITGYGLKDGIIGATEAQFNDVYRYDMQGNLNIPKDENEKNDIKEKALEDKNVKSILFINSKNGSIKSKNVRSEDAYVVVPEGSEEFNKYIKLYLNDVDLKLKDDGVIITEKLSRLVDKNIGDTIEMTIDDKIIKAKISDITQQYIQHYVYMSPMYYEKITGEKMAYNSFYGLLKDTSEKEENDTSYRLKTIADINSISFKNNSRVDYNKSIDSINSVVLILIISAGVLAFVVIYNLTNINITERRRELATIKLLGFYDKELASYIYRENIILTLIGSFAGIFVGLFLNKFVLSTAETNVIKFLEKINPIYFVYSVLLTILFSVIVNLAMYKRFGKIDMIESLKSAE